jgi:hypothetical protein
VRFAQKEKLKMATIPVTQSAGSIARFLKHIQTAGVPAKVNNPYLKAVGFKSSNDSALLLILKAINFIDASGTPTDKWSQYRDATQAGAVLAESIKACYSGLFDIYPDAERKDDEAIANWIRTNTTFSGITVGRAVKTFKALCAEADFSAQKAAAAVTGAPPASGAPATTVVPAVGRQTPSVNINIELQLPSTNDPEVYENFFKAMKKYLLEEAE